MSRMKSHLENALLWLLRLGVLATLVTPLIYSGKFLFPYIVPRATYFQLVTELLLVLSFLYFVATSSGKHLRLKTPVGMTLLLFLGVNLLSTIFSADPSKSFSGSFERAFGFFHLLHYGALFLAATIVFQDRRMLIVTLMGSFGVQLYASVTFSSGPPQSIMGNPTFLAASLLIHIFLCLWLITRTKHRALQMFLAGFAVFFTAVLLGTGVRGAFLGLVGGFMLAAILSLWRYKEHRLHLIGALAIFALLYLTLFVNRDHPLIHNNYVLSRITNFSTTDSTIQSRFSMWRMAFEGFQERPLLGWGRENFSHVFNTHFHPSFDLAGVSEGWEDRAHNVVFDELVTSGLLGLTAYLLLFGTVFYVLRRESALIGLLVAYTIQNFFGVENINSFMIIVLLFAYASNTWPEGEKEKSSMPPWLSSRTAVPTGVIGLMLLTAGLSYGFTIMPALGNRSMAYSYRSLAMGETASFTRSFQKAQQQLQHLPYLQLEANGIMANILLSHGSYNDTVAGTLKKLHRRVPAEQRFSYVLSQLLYFRGIPSQRPAYVAEARKILHDLLEQSPERGIFKTAYAQAMNASR